MSPKTPKLLEDIRDAAAFIREAVSGKTADDYRRERLLRQAVERNFEIIGEAMNRLTQHDPDTAARISKHRQIVDTKGGTQCLQSHSRTNKCGRLEKMAEHIASNLWLEAEDFGYTPFDQRGGLGRVHQLFGAELPRVIAELNRELVA
jgi:hypothetical protein